MCRLGKGRKGVCRWVVLVLNRIPVRWELTGSYMGEQVDGKKCGEEIGIEVQMMGSQGS